MNKGHEEQFRQTLKTIVIDEPEKLAFFDGAGTDAGIPPFIPSEQQRQHVESYKKKRKYYNSGMTVAASFALVFLCVAALGFGRAGSAGGPLPTVLPDTSGGGGITASEPAPPPMAAQEDASVENKTADDESSHDNTDGDISENAGRPAIEESMTEDNGPSAMMDNGLVNAELPAAEENTAGDTGSSVTEENSIVPDAGDPAFKPVTAPKDKTPPAAAIIAVIFAALFVFFLIKRVRLR